MLEAKYMYLPILGNKKIARLIIVSKNMFKNFLDLKHLINLIISQNSAERLVLIS